LLLAIESGSYPMEFHPQNHCSGPCKHISSTLLSHPA
jgi:hypothetical protein